MSQSENPLLGQHETASDAEKDALLNQLAEIDSLLELSEDAELRQLRTEIAGQLGLDNDDGIALTEADKMNEKLEGLEITETIEEGAVLVPKSGEQCLVVHGPLDLPISRTLHSCLVLLPAMIMSVDDSTVHVHILSPLDGQPERQVPVEELLPPSESLSAERGQYVAVQSRKATWELARVVEVRQNGTEILVEASEKSGKGDRDRPRTFAVGHDAVVPVTIVPLDDAKDHDSNEDEGAFDIESQARMRLSRSHSPDTTSSDSDTSLSSLPLQPQPTSFASWESHTRGIASKLLLKMGYKPGLGLGKEGQGIVEPVEAVRVAEKRGLGFEKEKKAPKRKERKGVKEEERPRDMFDFLNGAVSRAGIKTLGSPTPSSRTSTNSSNPGKKLNEHLLISDRRAELAPLLLRAKQRLLANTRDPNMSRHYREEIGKIETELKGLLARERVLLEREKAAKLKRDTIKF